MNALIVDDNEIARTTIKKLVEQVKDLELAGECTDAMHAYNLLQDKTVDLILLDNEMPGMPGIELTKTLGNIKPLIIFTTSKTEYAVEAFELNVVDYLIKPISSARFIQAITRAKEIFESKDEEVKMEERAFVFIRDSAKVRRLKLDDILYAEAMGDFVKLHTATKFFAIHTTLKAVEDRLPASNFIRVHRFCIVSLDKIDTIQSGVVVIRGKAIPVADAFRASLSKKIHIL